jgi:hypothetical protein
LPIDTENGRDAAVLAHLLSAEDVVPIEVDATPADHARRALNQGRIRIPGYRDSIQGCAVDAPNGQGRREEGRQSER